MHYFITGATGFVGRRLCRQLLESGNRVTALVRSYDDELEALGAEQVVGDILRTDSYNAQLEGKDVVIHCAGDAVFGNGPHYKKVNYEATVDLISAVKQAASDLSRFIFVSTIGAVDRNRSDSCNKPLDEHSLPAPVSDYGRSKLEAENAVINSGLPYTIVRPTMVVGEGMRYNSHFAYFARNALSEGLVSRVKWTGVFSVVHVDDLCRALIACATHDGSRNKVFFCAGGEISLGEFFELCRDDVRRIPLAPFRSLFRAFSIMLPFSLKALLLPALTANDEALRALGWRPDRTVRQSLDDVIKRETVRLNPELPVQGATVITGAASGLGKALAYRLAPGRNRLILVDRNEEQLGQVADSIENAEQFTCDLSDEHQIEAMLKSSLFDGERIDELYSCAGFGARGNFAALGADLQSSMFKVNVLARLYLTHWLINHARHRQFARIVLVSSSSAFQPLPLMSIYSATNAAVLFMGEGVASEVRSQGIGILTVCPGGMQTAFQKSAGVRELESEKLMTPDEAAELVIKGVKKQLIVQTISFRSFAMSLVARVLPRTLSLKLWHKLMGSMR